MLTRILSTLCLWTLVLGSLWLLGEHAAVVLITVLTALTLHEFYDITARMGLPAFRRMGLAFSVLMTGGLYYLAWYADGTCATMSLLSTGLLASALIACCIRVLGEREPHNRVESIAATMTGLLFIPFPLQFLLWILLSGPAGGSNLVLCLWVVAVAKFCDVGALLTGLAFGRHRMAPNISPKKTWEGATAGVLVAAGVGAAIAHFADRHLPEMLTPAVAAIIAVPLAVIAIISDLMESALKRRADVKDTGTLIPGIGGAFDLADSLILTAPVACFIFLFLV